ncbi:MAG: hypothetical protein IJH48_02970 [Oscillospiraceae bacterium]|nr:hypothetical protein [Oscillospiraceae bacterium]
MKKRFSFVCIYLCLLTLLLCGAAELLAPDKGERLSESENRMLAAFPALSVKSVADGSFMSGFETYLSDAFPFRDGAAAFTDAVTDLVRIPDDGPATGEMEDALWDDLEEQEAAFQQLLEEGRAAEEAQSGPGPETSAEDEALPVAPADVEDVHIWLVRADGEREVIFTYPADFMVSLSEILNRYRAKLPEDGRLYFLSPQVADVANNIIGKTKYVGWGTDLVDVLQPLVDDGVVIVDDLAILDPYLNDAPSPLYPTKDYHWHAIAASITADALISSQGLAPADYDQYRYWLSFRHEAKDYSTEQLAGMSYNRETIEIMSAISPAESYFLNNITERKRGVFTMYEGGYVGFLGGHKGPWRLIEGGFHTGRNALVMGDCFTIPFIPYMAPYYDQIISTDVRDNFYSVYLAGANISDYIAHYGVDDIYMMWTNNYLFANGTISSRMSAYLDMSY